MPEPLVPTRIFCRLCGKPMAHAGTCPACGWIDRVGQLAESSRVRPPAVPTPSPPVSPAALSGAPAEPFVVAPESPSPPAPIAPRVVHPSPARATTKAASPPRPSGKAPPPRAPAPGILERVQAPFRTLWKRHLPPVRLVWIFLALIVWNGEGFLNRTVAEPLLLLPIVAVATDLAFQVVRFPRVRFPDAAIANGLFLSVILWPTEISLALVSVTIVTVGLRHAARWASHPLVNPAAAGIVLAAAVFALPQPWHVGSTLRDTALVGALGLILWSKARHTWRLWAPYFATNLVALAAIADLLGGSKALSLVVTTAVLGTTPVFYGFFMVTEPRTAPSSRPAMIGYAVTVGLAAAALPALFAEVTTVSALGVLTPYLALFAGNLFTLVLPAARGAGKRVSAGAPAPPLRLPARAASKP